MNQFIDLLNAQINSGEREVGELQADLRAALLESVVAEARLKVDVSPGYLDNVYEHSRGSRTGSRAVVTRPIEIARMELIGLCDNPNVSDLDLERLVRSIVERQVDGDMEVALATYARLRKPGEWFWDWWGRYVGLLAKFGTADAARAFNRRRERAYMATPKNRGSRG